MISEKVVDFFEGLAEARGDDKFRDPRFNGYFGMLGSVGHLADYDPKVLALLGIYKQDPLLSLDILLYQFYGRNDVLRTMREHRKGLRLPTTYDSSIPGDPWKYGGYCHFPLETRMTDDFVVDGFYSKLINIVWPKIVYNPKTFRTEPRLKQEPNHAS